MVSLHEVTGFEDMYETLRNNGWSAKTKIYRYNWKSSGVMLKVITSFSLIVFGNSDLFSLTCPIQKTLAYDKLMTSSSCF